MFWLWRRLCPPDVPPGLETIFGIRWSARKNAPRNPALFAARWRTLSANRNTSLLVTLAAAEVNSRRSGGNSVRQRKLAGVFPPKKNGFAKLTRTRCPTSSKLPGHESR